MLTFQVLALLSFITQHAQPRQQHDFISDVKILGPWWGTFSTIAVISHFANSSRDQIKVGAKWIGDSNANFIYGAFNWNCKCLNTLAHVCKLGGQVKASWVWLFHFGEGLLSACLVRDIEKSFWIILDRVILNVNNFTSHRFLLPYECWLFK